MQTDVQGTMGSCRMQMTEAGCHVQASQAAAQATHSSSMSCGTRTACFLWPQWKGAWSASPHVSAVLCGAQRHVHLPGAHYVFDTAFSRNFSLLESQREFVQRFRGQANSKQALPVLTSACPGVLTLLTWDQLNAGMLRVRGQSVLLEQTRNGSPEWPL